MIAVCVLLAVACGYDYRSKKIPNYLIILLVLWGVGWRILTEGGRGAFSYLGEAVLIMAVLYPLFKIGTVGAGDVKLLGVAAGFLPFHKIFVFLFVSLLIAAFFSLVKLWKEKYFLERMHYLLSYVAEVVRSGNWRLYLENRQERARAGICLSGPVLLGLLLYLGGAY